MGKRARLEKRYATEKQMLITIQEISRPASSGTFKLLAPREERIRDLIN
jgi:hypothetical protein